MMERWPGRGRCDDPGTIILTPACRRKRFAEAIAMDSTAIRFEG
jgi:hypothetical protein